MRLKSIAKIGTPLALVVAVAWLATAYCGPSKLEAQLILKGQQEYGYKAQFNSSVRPVHTWGPLIFEAKTSIRVSRGRKHNGRAWTESWGYDDRAAFFYTPWQVYQICLIEHSVLPLMGEDPVKMREAWDQTARKEAALEEALKKQAKEEAVRK